MKIEQKAGGCGISVWTNGFPLWFDITMTATNGEIETVQVAVRDLHDLRYCLDRVMSQLAEDKRG